MQLRDCLGLSAAEIEELVGWIGPSVHEHDTTITMATFATAADFIFLFCSPYRTLPTGKARVLRLFYLQQCPLIQLRNCDWVAEKCEIVYVCKERVWYTPASHLRNVACWLAVCFFLLIHLSPVPVLRHAGLNCSLFTRKFDPSPLRSLTKYEAVRLCTATTIEDERCRGLAIAVGEVQLFARR